MRPVFFKFYVQLNTNLANSVLSNNFTLMDSELYIETSDPFVNVNQLKVCKSSDHCIDIDQSNVSELLHPSYVDIKYIYEL